MHSSPDTIMPALFGLLGFFVLFAAAIVLLRWMQKRMGSPLSGLAGQGMVRVICRYPLGWQSLLMIVEVAGQQYVITSSRTGGVTLIDKLAEPVSEPEASGAFGERLKQVIARRGGGQ